MDIRSLGARLRTGGEVLTACVLRRPRPFFVGFAVTYRCNYRCRHCRTWEHADELDTASVLGVIDEMADAGVVQLGFTGGEPLVRDDLGTLIRHAAARGLIVHLNSNGAAVPERAEVLEGVRRLTISLEGPPDVHDSIRGPGAFQRAIAALETARGLGIGTRLSATINAANLDRLDEVIGIASDLSVQVSFQPALMTRLGSAQENRLHPEPGAYRAAMNRLIKTRHGFGPGTIANSASGLRHLARWPRDTYVACAGGILGCRMEPGGDVYHCGRVRVHRPGMNAVQAGFLTAFRSLGSMGCQQCWCANRLELNFLCGLKWDVLVNALLTPQT